MRRIARRSDRPRHQLKAGKDRTENRSLNQQ
jgi:hypothetical protein